MHAIEKDLSHGLKGGQNNREIRLFDAASRVGGGTGWIPLDRLDCPICHPQHSQKGRNQHRYFCYVFVLKIFIFFRLAAAARRIKRRMKKKEKKQGKKRKENRNNAPLSQVDQKVDLRLTKEGKWKKNESKKEISSGFGRDTVARGSSGSGAKAPSPPRAHLLHLTVTIRLHYSQNSILGVCVVCV